MRTKTTLLTASLLALTAGVPTATRAQEARASELQDGRWLPYVGCWVRVDATEGPMTCVVPEGSGVAFLTVVGREVTERRLLSGDGTARPTDVEGCTGTESARFSDDGNRLFTAADLTCGGTERSTRGLIAVVGRDQWMEARALGVEDGSVAWVQRYSAAPPTRIEAAGLTGRVAAGSTRGARTARAAAASVGVNDIIEAHARTDPEAIRAWIAETASPLPLDAKALTRLADAGVTSDVIDVAVAVSFPQRFAVQREVRSDRSDRYYGRDYGYGRTTMWGWWNPYGPYYYDPFYPYSRWGAYGGYYGNWGVYRPTRIVVTPVRPADSGSRGRVVNGRGYTRGSAPTAGSARPTVRSAPSSSSGAVRSSGHQSSGSSSKGKAKRRGGGGGR